MANKVILVDTSILIDYYRKTDKEKSVWIGLVRQGYSFAISVITKYEIYSGATTSQLSFWNSILQIVAIIPFDEVSVDTAVAINSQLKKKRKQINIADLFIAATAVANNLPLATLNKRHFDRIEALDTVA
ncbi:MAG: type II toxin-antitoxin system VapC family toxin [Parafilimonas sp.]